MRYTLVWQPAAEARLAEIWSTAVDRKAVTTAANAIDKALRFRPSAFGESRHASTRVLVEEPLIVVFDVSEQDRLVRILDVRHILQRG
jgi:plasmid stabilization system protein ParE